jgi:iron-sulfur cluster assembly protein
VDAVAHLGAEDVVDHAVLGETGLAREGGGHDPRLEVPTVARHLGARVRDARLDPVLQLFRGDHEATILPIAMITLTDIGAEKVRDFLSGQAPQAGTAGLRVGVRGGGCSGFQYVLAFDEKREGDETFEDKGITLLVDRPSLPYVSGSIIDFAEGLQGAGFKVENPNVVAACGCGSSFRVADEEEVSAV